MVGGIVIEVIPVPDHPKGPRIWVNCREKDSTAECAIYVEDCPAAQCIEPGDKVWWGGSYAYWCHYHLRRAVGKEIRLNRVGLSGVSRPVAASTPAP